MAELPERALVGNLKKEQEKERRRIRDRQRRQTMTVEEREKHLARRRRNYQLRRQRAEIARLDPQLQPSLVNKSEMLMLPSNENQSLIPVLDISVQCNGAFPVASDQSKGSLNAGHAISVGLEVPAHKLANVPRRSRLNHIKHLARSLDDRRDIGDSHKVAEHLTIKENADSSCLAQNGLRLNRVKRLARALNSDVMQDADHNHQNKRQVAENLPSGEFLLIKSNMPQVVEPNNA